MDVASIAAADLSAPPHPYASQRHARLPRRELDGIASAHAAELSAVIPGFAIALGWPDADVAQLSC